MWWGCCGFGGHFDHSFVDNHQRGGPIMKHARKTERPRMSLTQRAEQRLRDIEERTRRDERVRLQPRKHECRRVLSKWLDYHDLKATVGGAIRYIEADPDDDDEPRWEARVDEWRFYAEVDRDFDDDDEADPLVVHVAC